MSYLFVLDPANGAVLKAIATSAGSPSSPSGLAQIAAFATDAQTDFLAAFDLDYRDRRLRFLIAGLSWWYADSEKPGFPSRDELLTALDRRLGRVWLALD